MIFTLCFAIKSIDNRIIFSDKTTLSIAMDTNRFNYFLQNGYPLGFQLELFEYFAEYRNVNLDFKVIPDSMKFAGLNSGEFDIAVFSENTDTLAAKITDKYIYVTPPFDDSIRSVWLINNRNMKLMISVNMWLEKFKQQNLYEQLKYKYFHGKYKMSDKLSPYDNLLKKYSAEAGLDWRLIAAIAYHESNFRAEVVSPNGASGLMQLMPVTAEYFGVNDCFNPEDNLRGGIRYIVFLIDFFAKKGVPENEIVNFVLASYNAGYGTVENCMKATEIAGLNPKRWNDVQSVIPLMKDAKFAVNMRFNGFETLKFVNKVSNTYKHYRNFF